MKAYATFTSKLIIVFSWNLFSQAILVPKRPYEYDRTFENTYLSKREFDREMLSLAIPCLVRFFRQNLPAPDRVPIMIPATHISRNTQYLLKELQSEMTILLLKEKFNSTLYNQGLSIILLLDDTSVVENVTSNLMNLCSRSCIYMAIVAKFYRNKDDFMKDAELLVRLLWERKMANVAIISILENSTQLVKSLSFQSDKMLELSPPEFFGSCEEREGWKTEKHKIFSPLGLNNGIANIAFFETVPYVMVNDDNRTIIGVESDLLKAVCASLKLKLIADHIMWTRETNADYEIRIRLTSNQSYDMVLGALQWSPKYDIDYTFPYKVLFYYLYLQEVKYTEFSCTYLLLNSLEFS